MQLVGALVEEADAAVAPARHHLQLPRPVGPVQAPRRRLEVAGTLPKINIYVVPKKMITINPSERSELRYYNPVKKRCCLFHYSSQVFGFTRSKGCPVCSGRWRERL